MCEGGAVCVHGFRFEEERKRERLSIDGKTRLLGITRVLSMLSRKISCYGRVMCLASSPRKWPGAGESCSKTEKNTSEDDNEKVDLIAIREFLGCLNALCSPHKLFSASIVCWTRKDVLPGCWVCSASLHWCCFSPSPMTSTIMPMSTCAALRASLL